MRRPRLLDEETPAACLTVDRIAYDDTGQFVEFGRHIYRAAQYSIQSNLDGLSCRRPASGALDKLRSTASPRLSADLRTYAGSRSGPQGDRVIRTVIDSRPPALKLAVSAASPAR